MIKRGRCFWQRHRGFERYQRLHGIGSGQIRATRPGRLNPPPLSSFLCQPDPRMLGATRGSASECQISNSVPLWGRKLSPSAGWFCLSLCSEGCCSQQDQTLKRKAPSAIFQTLPLSPGFWRNQEASKAVLGSAHMYLFHKGGMGQGAITSKMPPNETL